ncbi:olfactory receptor 10C1-like [Eublepharis macularius]|uniref:Olfactory receptor 10C1-like n=1 Tax=Eublepharis macularius TaxID=481883 RepID=A0AA97K5D7_EUBMA|nr:olfactory receptor 10C1-like [Eublepharis macularius]
MENKTSVTEFIVLGFSELPEMKLFLFMIFLCLYFFTILGNITIIIIVTFDSALDTPMYFFLRNLSFLEICYTSVTIPNMLVNLCLEESKVSFVGCATQLYFFLLFAVTERFILCIMAYDCYIAICAPLRYSTIMNRKICIKLSTLSWVTGICVSLGHTTFIFTLPFCRSNVIHYFFCEIQPLLTLVCGDTYWNEVQVILAATLVLILPFALILVSYIYIVSTILKMPSTTSQKKAVSTCSSHITVVTVFFGTALFMYIRPKSSYSLDTDKWISLFYSVITPILNPFIYSFRNKEVKGALKRISMKINCTKI